MHEQFGLSSIKELSLDETRIKSCVEGGFFTKVNSEKADPTIDDNTVLQQEY